MEAVAKLDVDLARVVVMEAAEGEAVVDQQVAIRDVEGRGRNCIFLPKFLAEGEIDRRVARQVGIVIRRSGKARGAVGEARAVVNIRSGESMPRKRGVETDVQRVALVVIEGEESGGRGRADNQPAGEWSLRLRDLV